MTEHIPPVCTLSVGSSDEDCECSDEEDELEDSEDDVRSHRPRPRKAPVKSSLVSAAPVSTARAVSPIFISSDSEDGSPAIQQINEDPDADRGAITGTAHANRARGRTPIVISDDEIPGPASGSPRKTQTMRTPAGTSGTPFLALGRDPKLISGNERLLFVRSKRKTKKERDAAAIANVPQLETFFSQIAGTSSARVLLHRRLRAPVRQTPLANPSPSSPYDPRVHRPSVLALAPSSLHAVLRPRDHVLYAEGSRAIRAVPLQVADLRRGTPSTPPTSPPLRDHHKCCICWQLKSHPVTYICGHGFCYTCIRISLEHKWECPICRKIMTFAPFRVYAEEDAIASLYGDWDTTAVEYSWDGLEFPQLK